MACAAAVFWNFTLCFLHLLGRKVYTLAARYSIVEGFGFRVDSLIHELLHFARAILLADFKSAARVSEAGIPD